MKNVVCDIFLLTKHWSDNNGQLRLSFYGHSPLHGAIRVDVDNFEPMFFIHRTASSSELTVPHTRKENPLKDPDHHDVDTLYFKTQSDLRRAAEFFRLKNVPTFESDVDPTERYLAERMINAQCAVQGTAEKGQALTVFKNPQIKAAEVTPKFRVASIDIETGVASKRLYSIGVHLTAENVDERVVFMLGVRPDDAPDYLFCFDTEAAVLTEFLNWFQAADPDIILGWNVVGFDLSYLAQKCGQFNMPFSLGREHTTPTFFEKKRGGTACDISGRIIFDGPLTLKGAFYNFDDFRLDTVAHALLGKGKTITSTKAEKIAEIERQFEHDKAAFAKYNLMDCVLVTEIFQKTGLIEQSVQRAKLSGMMMNQLGRSVASFEHIYFPLYHRKGFVAINTQDVQPQGHAAGGYVLDPQAGIHDHIIVLDFKSLYPSVIRTFKIDPLSIINRTINTYTTPYGTTLSKSEHVLPNYIGYLLDQRQKAKDENDPYLSQAIKILMNSFYGVMGSFGCRFYHKDLPSTITGIGQFLLKESRIFIEKFGYRVVYGDTDSLFVKLRPDDAAYYDIRGEELCTKLNTYWAERIKKTYGLDSFLDLEYEKYYKRMLLPAMRNGEGGAKKRYCGLLMKGDKETLHFTGMESVRSDWTPLAKAFQNELYGRIFRNEPYETWMKQFVERVQLGEYDAQLVYRKRLRKATDEYVKNVPPHVKAAKLLKSPAYYINYVITVDGPQPIENQNSKILYQHYIDKQLEPIADSILKFSGRSFRELNKRQLSLF